MRLRLRVTDTGATAPGDITTALARTPDGS